MEVTLRVKEHTFQIDETTAMLRYSGGDARKLLNILELIVESSGNDPVVINDEIVAERLQQNPMAYDKDGEMHYDIISAFIKSIRGSDPDAALYWLARRWNTSSRSNRLFGYVGQEQFGLQRHQRRSRIGEANGESAGATSPAQCSYQIDERFRV